MCKSRHSVPTRNLARMYLAVDYPIVQHRRTTSVTIGVLEASTYRCTLACYWTAILPTLPEPLPHFHCKPELPLEENGGQYSRYRRPFERGILPASSCNPERSSFVLRELIGAGCSPRGSETRLYHLLGHVFIITNLNSHRCDSIIFQVLSFYPPFMERQIIPVVLNTCRYNSS